MADILYRIVIYPLELIIEVIFCVLYRIFNDPGICLIGVSIAVSVLTLPMYNMADRIQSEDNKKRESMDDMLKHIRKSFGGDEKLMMLQAYYKVSDYNPVYTLRSLLPLMIQIPFFTAAYHFLSHLEGLKGASFLIINDLSKADGLIALGDLHINLLPVLMTVINICSSLIYLRHSSLQDKIRTWGLAVFFLIILYPSPSGLVFYWTMNNLFSLVKNIVKALYKPKEREIKEEGKGNVRLFFGTVLVMALLFGIVNPVFVLRKSPIDFVPTGEGIDHLIKLIVSTAAVSSGFFLLWFPLVYYMAPGRIRKLMENVFFAADVIFVTDYFIFGRLRGNMSNLMRYDTRAAEYKNWEIPVNLIVCMLLIPAVLLLLKKARKIAVSLSYITATAFVLIAIICTKQTMDMANKELSAVKESVDKDEKILHLSSTGQNVIVLMLDRQIGPFLPYIMEDVPELKQQYAGFTYYPNTLSMGISTALGSGALYGGYEYSRYNRDESRWPEVQNEALRVLPKIFADAGYDVTVCDPPLSNGNYWISDLSIYDGMDGIRPYSIKGMFSDEFAGLSDETHKDVQKRNMFFYGIYRAMPLITQRTVYHEGTYWGTYFTRMGKTPVESGIFVNNYLTLKNLHRITDVQDRENCFIIMDNDTPHNGVELQLPGYDFNAAVDNSGLYDEWFKEHSELCFDDIYSRSAYMDNAAALKAVGEWLDYLRYQGVYDNSRIIIVADHGYMFGNFKQFVNESSVGPRDLEALMPILLVKDFGETEYKVSEELMTNADTPILATTELIDGAVNPYTGRRLDDIENRFVVDIYNFDTGGPDFWQLNGDDMYDGSAWTKVEK